MQAKIYHNPRCTKSRQTLLLLRDRGIELEVIEYLKNPPTSQELEQILKLLDKQPLQLMRKNEPEFSANNLSDARLDRNALISIMIATPKLIERPIVLANGKATIGRPPENVLDIL